MPNSGLYEEEPEKWITVNGNRIPVKQGQDPQEAIREKFSGAGGIKGQATRESRGYGHQESHNRENNPNKKPVSDEEVKKHYLQRYSVFKGGFESREKVTWDTYEKQGIVAGWDGFNVLVLYKGDIIPVHPDYIFKINELTKYGHWDAMDEISRLELLKENNLSPELYLKDYIKLPDVIKEIFKSTSPAGYGNDAGGFGTGVQGKVNPVSNEISVSERIRNEISRRAQQVDNTPPKILDESQEAKFEQNEREQGHQEAEGDFNPVYDDPKTQENPVGEGKLVQGGEPMSPEEEKPKEESSGKDSEKKEPKKDEE